MKRIVVVRTDYLSLNKRERKERIKMNDSKSDGNRLQLLVNYIMDNYYSDGSYPNRYVKDVADLIMKDFKGIPDTLKDHQIKTAIRYIEEDLNK